MQRTHQPLRVLMLVLCLWLAGCGATGPFTENSPAVIDSETPLAGTLLLWHWWGGAEGQLLNDLLNDFTRIYPDVTIIRQYYPLVDPETGQVVFLKNFRDSGSIGLGPDIIIGRSAWVAPLADQNLIQNLYAYEPNVSGYLPAAIKSVRYKEKLYGLPMALQTTLLYYNQDLLGPGQQPPQGLQEFTNQVESEGKKAVMATDFYHAFWGIQAFGGQLFDEQGRLLLGQGGFANWLSYLKDIQSRPNFVLSSNLRVRRELFINDGMTYYVGPSVEMSTLQAALGEDVLRTAPLPAALQPSAPLLEAEALMLSTALSEEQSRIAMRLAEFLTSAQQQRKMVAANVGKAPANAQVRVDPTLYPALAGFVAQVRTAVSYPQYSHTNELITRGNEVYVQVLEGVMPVTEAANQFTEQMSRRFGLESVELITRRACPTELTGTLQIWHGWDVPSTEALQELVAEFTTLCPEISLDLLAISQTDLLDRYRNGVILGDGPDIVLGSNRWIASLAGNEPPLIQSLDQLVPPESLQSFDLVTVDSMSFPSVGAQQQSQPQLLYGLPISFDIQGLYYKTGQVETPPRQLDALLEASTPESKLAMPVNFSDAFWGLAASGGVVFENLVPKFVLEGAIDWLDFLIIAREKPDSVLLSLNPEILNEAFLNQSEVVYLVGRSSLLNRMQSGLGPEAFRVATLPDGPQGEARQLAVIDGLMINPTIDAEQQALAAAFGRYLTNVDSQTLLMEKALRVPVNNNVTLDEAEYPNVAAFLASVDQLASSINDTRAPILTRWGDAVYDGALSDRDEPGTLLPPFIQATTALIESEQSDALTLSPTGSCIAEGEVRLWNTLPESGQDSIEALIDFFGEFCPNLTVESEAVEAESLRDRLQNAIATEQPPDFILAPHDFARPLRQEEYLKNISPLLIDLDGELRSTLLFSPYLPAQAVRSQQILLGIPYTLDTTAVYRNQGLVTDTLRTLDDLTAMTENGQTVAIDARFHNALWGLSTFGDLSNPFAPLAERWLAWLQEAGQSPNVVVSADPDRLRQLFVSGEAGVLISGPEALTAAREGLGSEALSIEPLPATATSNASPLLTVNAFMFSEGVTRQQTELALRFAIFAARPQNQTVIALEENQIPAFPTADLAENEAVASFRDQLANAFLLAPEIDMLPFRAQPYSRQTIDQFVQSLEALDLESILSAADQLDQNKIYGLDAGDSPITDTVRSEQ